MHINPHHKPITPPASLFCFPQNKWTDEDRTIMRLGFSNKMKIKRNRPERASNAHSNHGSSYHVRGYTSIFIKQLSRFFSGKSSATKKRRSGNKQASTSRRLNQLKS